MKKSILLLIVVLAMGIMSGCGNKNENEQSNVPADNTPKESKFEEKDGLLVYLDLKNSPFEESGLNISIKKGEDGYADFVKTDLKGNETKDYYKFDYSTNTVEKYYYVSAMGTAYYYYYDLEKDELSKVEDGDHNDVTEKMKSSGRWDSAAEKAAEEIKSLQDYFKEKYGSTIEEAVLQ
ncbi:MULTISPECIES: hypothetical protein [Tissierellales]|jgi:hypothetical protein|uniref:Lipoprotein n=1 Tax=Acidilutibacter cellobiosedens TaxID=2507161 RepID=A0A410QAK6_9FIRM|nr:MULTISPECIES: hypothetical protein [Tissierellales]MBE6082300.1 hypothetical protein [Tissierellaceae bacterium]QAT61023.1 hypothetical protein EQM13_05205 [Acidilutibacter cellobiosedens]SCL89420.1 hypothetical protein PP176A_1747 [Sporanaerobacter sp. PP17-6a]